MFAVTFVIHAGGACLFDFGTFSWTIRMVGKSGNLKLARIIVGRNAAQARGNLLDICIGVSAMLPFGRDTVGEKIGKSLTQLLIVHISHKTPRSRESRAYLHLTGCSAGRP